MNYNSVFKQDLFKDQVIIITGGGTGIGRCIAHELASLGAIVALGSRKVENLESTKQEIEDAGGKAFVYECNIREPESTHAFVQALLKAHGRIDGLVNNGGGQFMSPAQYISPNGWNAVVDTNLTGTWNMTQAVFNAYMEANGGQVVSILMEHAKGYPLMAHSGAARAGVENLTKSLAIEWAPQNVCINAVAAGVINSSGLQRYPDEVKAMLPMIAKKLPAQRFGSESEISAMVTFLLSPAASFITGQTMWVDGGGSLYTTIYEMPEHDNWSAPFDGFSEDDNG